MTGIDGRPGICIRLLLSEDTAMFPMFPNKNPSKFLYAAIITLEGNFVMIEPFTVNCKSELEF